MARAGPPERTQHVEGVDDKYVVRHLRSRYPDIPELDVRALIGFNSPKPQSAPKIKTSGQTALGIRADARAEPARRSSADFDGCSAEAPAKGIRSETCARA